MELDENEREHPQIKAIVIFIILMLSVTLIVSFVLTSDDPQRNAIDNVVPKKSDILPQNYNFNNLEHAQTTDELNKVFLHKYQITQDIAKKISDFYCTDPNDDYCKVRSFITYIKANIKLIYWDANLYYENPIYTILKEQGDFDALNIVFANLAKASGLPTKFVIVGRKSFVLVKVRNPPPDAPLEDGWMHIDAACKTCMIGSIRFEHKTGRQIFELTN